MLSCTDTSGGPLIKEVQRPLQKIAREQGEMGEGGEEGIYMFCFFF
jgi:hypothetical protein